MGDGERHQCRCRHRSVLPTEPQRLLVAVKSDPAPRRRRMIISTPMAGPNRRELGMPNEETTELQNRGNFWFPPRGFSGDSAPPDSGKHHLPVDTRCTTILY